MKNRQGQSGFSLVEVLFAVILLTIGMIFVASQFPIALANSRDIAQASTANINTHNVAATLKFQLQNEITNGTVTYGNADNAFLCTDGMVHFLIQPNYRWTQQDFVLDEVVAPCSAGTGILQYFIPPYAFFHGYNQIYSSPPGGPVQIPGYFTTYFRNYGVGVDQLCPENIGMMVSPPVERFDKDVIEEMQHLGKWPPAYPFSSFIPADQIPWNTAVFDIASKRNTSWCAFYQCMDPLSAGGRERTFRFIIVTLELGKDNPYYAPQNPTVTNPYVNITPLPSAQDRMLPLPWYVRFDLRVPNVGTAPIGFTPALLLGKYAGPHDRFTLEGLTTYSPKVLNLLREGTLLIDAVFGQVYRVTEILDLPVPPPPNTPHQIRLDRNIPEYDRFGKQITFRDFWIIPPAIINPGRIAFVDRQPVIQVYEETIQF